MSCTTKRREIADAVFFDIRVPVAQGVINRELKQRGRERRRERYKTID